MNKKLLISLLLVCFTLASTAQKTFYQTIRGQVVDKESQMPLPGVNIIVLNTDPVLGVMTDVQGYFKLEKVPTGRQSIQVSFIGYQTRTYSNLSVSSGKELILNVELEEQVTELDAVVITANGRKDQPINKMASISARSFTVEETSRYPGSYGDPARMAANYAGVMSVRDNRNDIIIRGNSSSGLLWRLDGIEIPNPNHFSASGTTGGPITILNNNLLSNSDFMTGAFPAEYGNALAGVFDLKMRNGNNEKREYWSQFSYNGLEFGAEGPFSKKSNASYIISYRYSLTDLLDLLGAAAETTSYQDLSFKINIPMKKGRINLFGMGGKSYIEMFDSNDDQNEWTYDDWGEDLSNGSMTGVAGLSYMRFLSNTTRLIASYSIQGNQTTTQIDTFSVWNPSVSNWAGEKSTEVKHSFSTKVIKKLSAKNNFSAGITYDYYTTSLTDSSMVRGDFRVDTDVEDRNLDLIRGFSQFRHKHNDRISTYIGLYGQYFLYNDKYSIEPRLGFNLTTRKNHIFNFGYGLHSQIQPRMLYFVQTETNTGGILYSNQDLDLTKSHQFVMGYDYSFNNNLRLKFETYYQYLYDIPVDITQPQYSTSNYGAEYFIERIDSLTNEGTGQNYGIELTLERFLHNNFYFLFTGSLYQSKYKGYDGIERNTAFNGNFALNLLGGYEFTVKRNLIILLGLRTTWAGGRPYVPFDVEETMAQGQTVYDWDKAFEKRGKDYLRFNLRIGMKRNRPKLNMEIGIDLQYRTNYTSVYERRIDPLTGKVYEYYEMGLYPMGTWRIQF